LAHQGIYIFRPRRFNRHGIPCRRHLEPAVILFSLLFVATDQRAYYQQSEYEPGRWHYSEQLSHPQNCGLIIRQISFVLPGIAIGAAIVVSCEPVHRCKGILLLLKQIADSLGGFLHCSCCLFAQFAGGFITEFSGCLNRSLA
jgi:hypothetical protein